MPAGALTPITRWAILNDGVPVPGAKLYTYLSGTSTPHPVYTDAALSVEHTNPVVADATGTLPVIYLDAVSYRVLITDADGATVFPAQDNVYDFGQTQIAAQVAGYFDNGVCDGRLTLTSNTPVTTSDVTAATTIYFTPFKGNRIGLYDGSAWSPTTFSQVSLSLGSDAADLSYDVFGYLSGGALAIERLAWSSLTARATALTTQDGVLVKSGDATRRYLGTYATTGTIGQTEDSVLKRLVYNHAHQFERPLRVVDATNSWTYTTDSWRQANGSTANQVQVVVGVAGAMLSLRAEGHAENSGGANTYTGIGEDSTTAAMATLVGVFGVVSGGTAGKRSYASAQHYPAVGLHTYAWLERSATGGTTTWFGDAGLTTFTMGMSGWIRQ